jgi:hypothetical protein
LTVLPNRGGLLTIFPNVVREIVMQKSKARRRATKRRKKQVQNTTFKTQRKSSKSRFK